ncbi:hypothetical protein KO465_04370 [Candidatus Micrarchaeota archaeon]|jgi:hypothetical protein|nr:hypothetical protein [Candidatus Micrarchaeota archaeon]
MALFGNRQQAPAFKNVWVRTIGLAEFSDDTPDGLTVTSGVWYTWRYRVPAQQVVRLGSGAIMNGVDNRGVLMIDIKDDATTPAKLKGDATIQLGYENANQTNFIPIWEGRLDQINDASQAANRMANNVLAEMPPGARQDSYLVVRVRPSETLATAFSDADSDFRVPVTIYTL